MAEKILGTVRDVAEGVIKVNMPFYDQELLKTVPKKLQDWELTNENLFLVSNLVDKYRAARCGYLGGILGYPLEEVFQVGGDLYDKLINLPNHDHLPPEQRQIIKEIKFLNNLALKVAHQ